MDSSSAELSVKFRASQSRAESAASQTVSLLRRGMRVVDTIAVSRSECVVSRPRECGRTDLEYNRATTTCRRRGCMRASCRKTGLRFEPFRISSTILTTLDAVGNSASEGATLRSRLRRTDRMIRVAFDARNVVPQPPTGKTGS